MRLATGASRRDDEAEGRGAAHAIRNDMEEGRKGRWDGGIEAVLPR